MKRPSFLLPFLLFSSLAGFHLRISSRMSLAFPLSLSKFGKVSYSIFSIFCIRVGTISLRLPDFANMIEREVREAVLQ